MSQMTVRHILVALSFWVLFAGCNKSPPSQHGSLEPSKNNDSLDIPTPESESESDSGIQTVDNLASLVAASQLNIDPVGFVPLNTNPLALSLPTSLNLAGSAEIDSAESKLGLDRAQAPLDRANQLLCLFKLVQPGLLANQGPYVASGKFIKNCFATAADAASHDLDIVNGQEAVVNAVKLGTSSLVADIYLTIPYFRVSVEGGTNADLTEANLYIRAKIAEPSSQENPLGIFQFTYQAFRSNAGVEENQPFWEGFASTVKDKSDPSAMGQIYLDYYQVINHLKGSRNRKLTTRMDRAKVRMTVAAPAASHGKSIETTLAVTESQSRMDPVGSQSGNNAVRSKIDPKRRYSFAYSANESRSLSKFTEIPEACQSAVPDSCSLSIGAPCTDGNSDGKCDEDTSKFFCNVNGGVGHAGGDASCVYEGSPCTDLNSDGKCDAKDAFYYCNGIARIYSICLDDGAPLCKSSVDYAPVVRRYGLFYLNGSRVNLPLINGYSVVSDKVDAKGNPIKGWLGSKSLSMKNMRHGEMVSIRSPEWESPRHLMFDDISGQWEDSSGIELRPKFDFWVKCFNHPCPKGPVGEVGQSAGSVINDFILTNLNNSFILKLNDVAKLVVLSQGDYSFTRIVEELQSKLAASTTNQVTASYDPDEGKFQISCASCTSSNFSIEWQDPSSTIADLLGFNKSRDVGANAYQSDSVRATGELTITQNTNDRLVFSIVDAGVTKGPFTAIIPAGTYTNTSLGLMLQSKMTDACSAHCHYITLIVETAYRVNDFGFGLLGGSTLNLLWSDPGSTVASTIGFKADQNDYVSTGGTLVFSDEPTNERYRFNASSMALYYGNRTVKFANGIGNSWLYPQFQVVDAGGNTEFSAGDVLTYRMFRSVNMRTALSRADGQWFDFYAYAASPGGSQSPLLRLTCSACPKDVISQSDVISNSYSQTANVNFYFQNSALYRQVGASPNASSDVKVAFDKDVESGDINFDFSFSSNSQIIPLKLIISAEYIPGAAALWDPQSQTHFWAGDPIVFQNELIRSEDRYNVAETNQWISHTHSDITLNGRPLEFGAEGLSHIAYESKLPKTDLWGNPYSGPKFTFRSRTQFTSVNSTGPIVPNTQFLLAPLYTEHDFELKNDCSQSLQNNLNSAVDTLTLPEPMDSSKQNIKLLMPPKPILDVNGETLRVRVIDGKCAIVANNGSCS